MKVSVSRSPSHIRVYGRVMRSTPNGRRFCTVRLPVRQRLIWAGPVFILVQRRLPRPRIARRGWN